MADFSIDQNRLPGVKEVCRDFAVLEDGCLAYSLQEQEIESHLASNIHKSRLIRSDIQVARRLQEEEDLQVQARGQRWQRDIDQSDTEVAKGIQDRLVRQAEQQRRQEKMDEAIARKLQEKEMKEGKKKKKQQEVFVEPHCEGRGAPRSPSGSARVSKQPESRRVRFTGPIPPDLDRGGRSEHQGITGRGGRGRDGREGSQTSRSVFYSDGGKLGAETQRAPSKKEKPARPPPPRLSQDQGGGREGEGEREGEAESDRDGHREGGISRVLAAQEEVEPKGRCGAEGLGSGFEESSKGRRDIREPQDPWEEILSTQPDTSLDSQSSHHPGEPDWNVQGNYSMKEVTQDINRLALQDQELRDMEVARKLYKEEQKASQADTRAAQVAQDEEIARLLMDEERRRCMSSREKSRPDVNSRASSEQVVRARSHEDSQRSIKEKPARPPPPTRNRENVDPCPTRLPSRTEPTSRGPNCRR